MEQKVGSGMGYSAKILIAFTWVASVITSAFLGFNVGRNGITSPSPNLVPEKPASSQIQGVSTTIPNITPDLSQICAKSGVSPQSEYLPTYIIQEGDTLQKIAQEKLGDTKRVNELIKLNENTGGLVVGGVVYLPPESIKSSTGNLALVSGRIVHLDNSIWQLSYGGGKEGLGIAIPAYYFSSVSNKDEFKLGDCVTVFIENGVKVYTISRQE